MASSEAPSVTSDLDSLKQPMRNIVLWENEVKAVQSADVCLDDWTQLPGANQNLAADLGFP